jgi:hypothetical protein
VRKIAAGGADCPGLLLGGHPVPGPHPLCSTEGEIRTAKAPIHSQARLAAHHVTRTMTGADSDPAHRSLTALASLTRGRKQ